MSTLDLVYVLDVLNAMSDAELAMRDLYKVCAEKYPHNEKFWNKISEAEDKHCQNMIKMTGIVSLNHEEFILGRRTYEVGIRTFIKGIKSIMEGIEKGKTTEQKTLYLTRDLETSILES